MTALISSVKAGKGAKNYKNKNKNRSRQRTIPVLEISTVLQRPHWPHEKDRNRIHSIKWNRMDLNKQAFSKSQKWVGVNRFNFERISQLGHKTSKWKPGIFLGKFL
jgi:hypothetical protein